MIKMLLTFIIGLMPLAISPVESKYKAFMDNIDKGYLEYEVETIENTMYHLAVVRGNNKGKPCYGISFTSAHAGEYYCVLKAENVKYSLPTDNRKDSMAVAIESEVAMVIEIYNKEGKLQATKKDLPIFTIKDLNPEKVILGEGNGVPISKLSLYTEKIPFYKVYLIVILSIIGVTGLIILLMFVFKKGMFNANVRKNGVINMRGVLEEQTFDHPQEDYFEDVNSENIIVEKDSQQDSIINDSNNTNDLEKITNIKEYLEKHGFSTNYSELTEDEKNKVMLELIKLKNNNQITINDYYDETVLLWKKQD